MELCHFMNSLIFFICKYFVETFELIFYDIVEPRNRGIKLYFMDDGFLDIFSWH